MRYFTWLVDGIAAWRTCRRAAADPIGFLARAGQHGEILFRRCAWHKEKGRAVIFILGTKAAGVGGGGFTHTICDSCASGLRHRNAVEVERLRCQELDRETALEMHHAAESAWARPWQGTR